MRKLLYLSIAICISFSACSDSSTETEPILCNNGYSQDGECICDEGYTGTTCGEQETPDVINISEVTVTRLPDTTDDGGSWDFSSGPDIYVEILKGDEIIWESDTYYENASDASDYDFDLDIQLTEPNEEYTINLYDYDESGSDFMGGVVRTPYNSDNEFPDNITFDADGSVAFEISASYAW